MVGLFIASALAAALQAQGAFQPLPAGSVRALGWAETLIRRNIAGMGGHFGSFDPDQFEKPYATRDFSARLDRRHPEYEIPGWCAEMAGQYRLGQVSLALSVGDDAMRKSFRKWMNAALSLQEKEGTGYFGAYRAGDNRFEGYNPWGAHFALKALRYEYEATGDRRILEAIRNGVLWFAEVWLPAIRRSGKWWDGDTTKSPLYCGPTIVETACDAYLLTGDGKLLAFAKEFAALADEHADWTPANRTCRGGLTRMSLDDGACHVVAYEAKAEAVAALAMASGDANIRKAAVALFDDYWHKVGWQVHGAPRCAMEHVGRPKSTGETEYCAFVNGVEWLLRLAALTGEARFGDLAERLVFNGAMGARKKDERAIAYSSAPNMFLATKGSATESCLPYYTVYTPCLFAACCPAQSLRLVPAYLQGAVMRANADDLAVVAYGPYEVRAEVGGVAVRIASETAYPFEEKVRLRVIAPGWKGNLRLRRPSWATSVRLTSAGKSVSSREESGWLVVSSNWSEAALSVEFGVEPKIVAVSEDGRTESTYSVERGPLVFARAIPAVWSETAPVAPSSPLPTGWSWHEARPEKPVTRHELPAAVISGAEKIRVVRSESGGYPWENPPVRLRVCLCPSGADCSETVELVPYGTTTLRETAFCVRREAPAVATSPSRTAISSTTTAEEYKHE